MRAAVPRQSWRRRVCMQPCRDSRSGGVYACSRAETVVAEACIRAAVCFRAVRHDLLGDHSCHVHPGARRRRLSLRVAQSARFQFAESASEQRYTRTVHTQLAQARFAVQLLHEFEPPIILSTLTKIEL